MLHLSASLYLVVVEGWDAAGTNLPVAASANRRWTINSGMTKCQKPHGYSLQLD